MDRFIALLTSLPTGSSTTRMRVWRALKETGCGVLRDGVYVLPAVAPQAAGFADVGTAIRGAGGFAMTAELAFKTPAEIEHVRKLFDRGREYGALVAKIGAAKSALSRLGRRKADTLVQRLRRSLDALVEIDFYPGHAQSQAKQALSALEGEKHRLFSLGEPQSSNRKVRRLDARRFRNRTWVTRKSPWVDRLASAWLIRRFIDTKARFVWLDKPRDRPKDAVGFDFDGADFTHVGDRVTFEVLLGSFDLAGDPALERLAAIVHVLDVGGIPVEEARGLEMVLKGARDDARSDDELVLAAARIFDHVYSALQGEKSAPGGIPEGALAGSAPYLPGIAP